MLAWMTYAALVAVPLAVAAALAGQALHLTRRSTRWVWAAAIVTTLALSVLAPWRGAPVSHPASHALATDAAALGPSASGAGLSYAELVALAREVTIADGWARALDRPLALAWAASSLATLLWLALGVHRLRMLRRTWQAHTVDGDAVLVSPDVGPAVSGLLHPAIVLPRWALALDAEPRRLMLAHEREHVRARDPLLLAGAALALVAMPWSPALWYLTRRLRLAVEMDCDRRVLRRHPGARAYGVLLLEVGQRVGRPAWLPVAALTVPPGSLLRRIEVMTMQRPRHAVARAVALTAIAAALALAACEAPRPTGPAPSNDVPLASLERASRKVAVGDRVTAEEVRAALTRFNSELLTAPPNGGQHLFVVVDSSRSLVQMDWKIPAHQAESSVRLLQDFGTEDIASVELARFAPGELTLDSIEVVWVRLTGTAEDSHWRRNERTTVMADTVVMHPRVPVASDSGQRKRVSTQATAGAMRTMVGGGGVRVYSAPEPLFFVDGVETDTESASKVYAIPGGVERMEAIGPKRARQLYGEKGANGVVLITTKKP